jgi:hypothetical protein
MKFHRLNIIIEQKLHIVLFVIIVLIIIFQVNIYFAYEC